MASSSFTLSNNLLKFTTTPPQQHNRASFRVSANYATAERFSTAQTSFYDVLGIQTGATCQEIKSAYRKLARVVHPDVASSNGREYDTSDEFMKVHTAYATLSDPDKRAVYDGTILVRGRRGGIVSGNGVTYERRRNWETDQCWILSTWLTKRDCMMSIIIEMFSLQEVNMISRKPEE